MPIDHLRKVLSIIPIGIVPKEQHSAVVSQLAECWDHLMGSAEGGMTAAKVWRCEDLSWTPPILSFQIERHGGVVLGSKRAEMQTWTIDVTQATATLAYTGTRQLLPNDPPLDVKRIAAQIAANVVNGREDRAINRSRSGSVRIRVGEVILTTVKQTTAGRRRRFTQELERLLAPQGWCRKTAGTHLIFERRE